MLRTNLASRPFYNERVVRAGLLLVALLTAAFTLFNVARIVSLRGRSAELNAQIAEANARFGELRANAQKIRQALNQQDVDAVQAAARQANQLIERRAFSWTGLFNQFEATLPASVRITAVQPQVDKDGRMVLAITAVSRRVEDLDTFIEQMEKSGAFASTLARAESVEEDGTVKTQLQGFYRGTPVEPRPEKGAGPAAGTTTALAGGRP